MIAGVEPGSLRHWRIDQEAADLSGKVGCSPLVAAILRMMGVEVEEEVQSQFSPDLHSLMEQLDLGEGVAEAKELFDGIGPGAHVVVYGDYDVDGVSATTLAARLFSGRNADVRYFIPHRHQEGYGLHERVIRKIAERGCDVLVAVDCGTSSRASIATARRLGMKVLVFDHHLPQEGHGIASPDAILVNPQLSGNSEAKTLCGAAVLWAWAWKCGAGDKASLQDNLGLIALATVADCVPLGPLNRALLREGLKKIREGREPGLTALSTQLGLDLESLDGEALAMKLIPCLNAPGRLELADLAVKVLSVEPPLGKSVDELVSLNRKRQGLTAKILEEAAPLLNGERNFVAGKEDWPVGVLSGVASRLCSETGRPVALAAPVSSGLVRGTLRVPKGGNAVSVLERLSPTLQEWGGHRLAAGFSVSRQQWPVVRDSLESLLAELESPKEEIIDVLDLHPAKLSLECLEEIERLGPFGIGNPGPLFYVPCEEADRLVPLGKTGQHLRIAFGDVSIVAFRSAELLRSTGSVKGWIYRARKSFWRGRLRVELLLEKPVLSKEPR
ncbi:MAG: DHH family phosphoesterase [Synergistales bacterium]